MLFIDLRKIFPDISGFFIHVTSRHIYEITSTLENNHFEVLVLSGGEIQNEATFFAEAARVFQFPGYFGNNWDAFNDSMSEFWERPDVLDRRLAIIWKDVDVILKTDLQTYTSAVCALFEQVMRIAKKNQIEVFLLQSNDPNFADS